MIPTAASGGWLALESLSESKLGQPRNGLPKARRETEMYSRGNSTARLATRWPGMQVVGTIVVLLGLSLSAHAADDTFGYAFNAADQLTSVTMNGQTVATISYDGDGLRVRKAESGGEVAYIRDEAGNVLAEYDQDGVLLAEYIYANGHQVAKVERPAGVDTFRFFHPDHLGTALVITDEVGDQEWRGEYFPFGEEYSSQGTPNRYRFVERETDEATGLTYMHARYYNPDLGRFLTVDPVGGRVEDSQSWQRYAYVRNNPINLVDPTGAYVGMDDAAFSLAGAVVGLGAQGITDLISGEVSGWEDYTAAAVGGAVGGETLLYTGPIGAGAAGGLSTNLTKQALKNLSGKQAGFDALSAATDTGVGAATGLLPGLRIQGVSAGRGSMNQVYKQMVTKLQNGSINSISATTAAKMVIGRTTETAFIPGAGAAAAAAASGVLPSSEERRPPAVQSGSGMTVSAHQGDGRGLVSCH